MPRALVPEVAIHGRHGESWNRALDADASVWSNLRGVAEPATGAPRWWRRRVVIPLLEPHIATMPDTCYALLPDAATVDILADKASFVRYAGSIGAAGLLPLPIALDSPTFPAVLKRTNLNSGHGVTLVISKSQLDEKLARPPWAGAPVLLQEAIRARRDYVTHVVCVEGTIVWHCTYSYRLSRPREIRGAVEGLTIRRGRLSSGDIGAFESLLKPLGYNGPANIDYKRRRDGSLAIFEINPRLGGSLMRPENVRDLAACLRAIVRYARWRPADRGVATAAGGELRA